MKKSSVIIGLLGLVVCVAYALFSRKDNGIKNQLIVGTASGYAPFVSVDHAGHYEGFDIDVARNLAHEMGKELVIRDLGSMVPLFTALDQGSIDVIIWGLSITHGRLKKVAMIRYEGDTVTTYPLIFWKEIPNNVKTIHDMEGMAICCEPATSQESVLLKYPGIIIVPTEKVDDALLNLQTGKAIAALVEPAIARKFQKKYPEIKMLPVELSAQDQVHGIGIAIKKEKSDRIKAVEIAVAALEKRGILKQLAEKWGIS